MSLEAIYFISQIGAAVAVACSLVKDVFPKEHLRIIDDVLLRDMPVEHILSIVEVWHTTYDRLFANPACNSATVELS